MSTTTPVSTIVNVAITSVTSNTLGFGAPYTYSLAGILSLPDGNNSNFSIANNLLQILAAQGTPALVSFQLPVNPTSLTVGYYLPGIIPNPVSSVVAITFSFNSITFGPNSPLSSSNCYLNSTAEPVTVTILDWTVTVPPYSINILDPNNGAAWTDSYTINFTGTGVPGSGTQNFPLDPLLENDQVVGKGSGH